jgi:hypothetical protein
VCCVASNAKRKEKKEALVTSNNESKVTYRKILLSVRRPEGTSTVLFRYFGMCSATFDKLLVLFGPSLTFQDTRMRNSVPLEQRLAVALWQKKTSALLLIHTQFIHYTFVWNTHKN